jgi:hypothetical protein
MDVTGEGGGLFSIMSGRWSPKIQPVEFGGAAEKVQISPDRPTTWHELYGNRVTMLYYAFRRFVEGGQIRGLRHTATIKELTSREKKMRAGKTVVLPKSECKAILGKSPDFADAAVIIAEFLRRKGVAPAGSTGGGGTLDFKKWNEMVAKMNPTDQYNYRDEGAAYAS